MEDPCVLGQITCPSGQLALMDGGYLGLWSGDRSPAEVRDPEGVPAVDFEVVGADAEAAARSLDRQSGRYLYDIPEHAVAEFVAMFDAHCREHGFAASLQPYPRQVPHRERLRRAVAAGDPDFLITGVPVIPIGSVPSDRPLVVTAFPGEWGWRQIRIAFASSPAVRSRPLGRIGVDAARFVFADADALGSWVHEDSLDGLADVAFWGGDEDLIAAEFGAERTGTPGEDHYGWVDLPIQQAYDRAVALNDRRNAAPRARFAFDFRPHSHHFQVMAAVRAAEHEAATITVGDAEIMMAMTSVGDGFFPVHLDLDAAGAPVAATITIDDGE
ncbi:hypothetical protein [Actinoplanes sp. NPDC026619]|uniref:hypothetical protein n=1 Tax=Actinoplanes sp. NPDC026619 TaxID=3155798 RepID=UPI0033CD443B